MRVSGRRLNDLDADPVREIDHYRRQKISGRRGAGARADQCAAEYVFSDLGLPGSLQADLLHFFVGHLQHVIGIDHEDRKNDEAQPVIIKTLHEDQRLGNRLMEKQKLAAFIKTW